MSDPNQSYGAVPPPPPPPPPGAAPGPPPVGPPSGPPFPAPPGSGGGDKSGNGLWIALAVVGVVALVGVIVALVLVLTADDKDAAAKADDITSSATSDTSASESSPTDEPTASPTTSATPTDAPTTRSPGGVSTADAVPNEPKAVVDAFLSSVLNGDCATAEDLVTEEYIEEEGDCDPDDIPSDFADQISYTVGTPKVNNAAGTATVPVDADFAGTQETSTVELVKVGGLWRVNEFN